MTAPAQRVLGFEIALAVMTEVLAKNSQAEKLRFARDVLRLELDRAKILANPRSLKDIAAIKGVSYEAVRAQFRRLYPNAKKGGRITLSREMAARLLAD